MGLLGVMVNKFVFASGSWTRCIWGANKAVFADFFRGPQTVGAFSNQIMQNSLAFCLSFMLQAALPEEDSFSVDRLLPLLMLILAGLIFPGYLVACFLRNYYEPFRSPPLNSGQ